MCPLLPGSRAAAPPTTPIADRRCLVDARVMELEGWVHATGRAARMNANDSLIDLEVSRRYNLYCYLIVML